MGKPRREVWERVGEAVGEDASIPLKWIRRTLARPLEQALEAIDRVPMKADEWERWRAVRHAVQSCLVAIREIERLAGWLNPLLPKNVTTSSNTDRIHVSRRKGHWRRDGR